MRAPTILLAALLVAAAGDAAAGPAIPRPTLELAGGTTFAVTGEPNDGGASFSVAAVWPVMDRVRFGVQLFADDVGSEITDLLDPNDEIRKVIETKRVLVLKEDVGTEPTFFYFFAT